MLGENLMEGVWLWKAPIDVSSRYECSVMLLIGNVLCCTVYQGNTPFTAGNMMNKLSHHLIRCGSSNTCCYIATTRGYLA